MFQARAPAHAPEQIILVRRHRRGPARISSTISVRLLTSDTSVQNSSIQKNNRLFRFICGSFPGLFFIPCVFQLNPGNMLSHFTIIVLSAQPQSSSRILLRPQPVPPSISVLPCLSPLAVQVVSKILCSSLGVFFWFSISSLENTYSLSV